MNGPRMFTDGCVWCLDYSTAAAAARMLAEAETEQDHDLVVGIARGGLIPAAVVAADLRLPMVSITARHNTADRIRMAATHTPRIDPGIDLAVISGARILLVDDICGSGATLAHVTAALSAVAGRIRCLTLCRNRGADRPPDAWVWDVADWVSFPWEAPPPEAVARRGLWLPAQARKGVS